jgi:Na+/H+ antiporter NhaD/arsenite permease-like protein
MIPVIILLFVIGYASIAFEHPLKLDKTVPALLMGVLLWTLIAIGHLPVVSHGGELISASSPKYMDELVNVLLHHIGKIAEILIFLMGAMTIVELVDLHKGFSVVTDRITTTNKKKIAFIIGWLAFLLSSVLDNLTTTIVFVSLLRKLIPNQKERLWYVALVVIAANAGGAWSPIGDVTTTMLWIGKKISTGPVMLNVFIPSVLCLMVPLLLMMFRKEFQGELDKSALASIAGGQASKKLLSSNTMFFAGIGALIFVPIFKSITHLPPYIGMMFGLGVVWLISEYIHPEEDFSKENNTYYTARHALSRIELSSILFFLGILLAITALESVAVMAAEGKMMGLLHYAAESIHLVIPNTDFVVVLIGLLSAVVDNVPLVAATMGMYSEPMDAHLWHFIAYSAGTGGSILIIGSAAGVAAMGMEKIDFIWYLRKIAWLAAAGFFAGCLWLILFQG